MPEDQMIYAELMEMLRRQNPPSRVDTLSARALLIAIYTEHSDVLVASGTGFAVDTAIGPCLVTARHCLTGRDHFTGKLNNDGAIPFSIRVYHRCATDRPNELGGGALILEELLFDAAGRPRWYEHHQFKDICDFAILPFHGLRETISPQFVDPRPGAIEVRLASGDPPELDGLKVDMSPGEPVSIIGYPFGAFTGSVWPLWTAGYLASEPAHADPVGRFFIDCRARGGQSGSPVYLKRRGKIPLADGSTKHIDGFCYSFLGLYSGRINSDSDIGIAWSAAAINETVKRLPALESAEPPSERVLGGPISRLTRKPQP